MQKLMKYLISFPNEHKQLGILSFQMVGAKKSKTIIFCKCFFHSGKKGNCMPHENKQLSKSTTVHRKYVRMGGDLHSYTGD